MDLYISTFVFLTYLIKVVLSVDNSSVPITTSDDFIKIFEDPIESRVRVIGYEPVVPGNCTSPLEDFTEKVTNLTRCIVVNARPIRMCVNCAEPFRETTDVYNSLLEAPIHCRQFYFDSDQIGIISVIYSQGRDLYIKNSCQNCQDNINSTTEFFDVARRFDSCFLLYNGTSPEKVNDTCKMCEDLYVKMNDIYKSFVIKMSSETPGGICMDIVDKMNITRHLWSQENCLKFQANVGYPNIITAVLVGVMPVFFYTLSKHISIIEDVKLVRPKRKSFTPLPPESLSSE